MISVKVDNAEAFWNEVNEKQLPQKFGIRINKPQQTAIRRFGSQEKSYKGRKNPGGKRAMRRIDF